MKKNKIYKTIEVFGRIHVLCESETRNGSRHNQANYIGTGLALAGVVQKGKNLKFWINNLK